MATDAEILDELEKVIDFFTQEFYAVDSEEAKRVMASFALGQVAGILMRRNK